MSFELAPFALPADYGEGIVSLADVKAHLGVLSSDQDDLIGVLRDAAIDMVERYCGVFLAVREGVEWKAELLSSPLRLGVWPVSAVTAVSWLDSDGETVTGDATIWRLGTRDEVLLNPGQSLPSGVSAGVTIEFTAGFETPPPALVQAVKMFTAHLFEQRGVIGSTSMSGEIPLGFRALCSAYRMPVI